MSESKEPTDAEIRDAWRRTEAQPYLQGLFDHMSDQHGLTLTESEMNEIVLIVRQISLASGQSQSGAESPHSKTLARSIDTANHFLVTATNGLCRT